MEDYGFRLIALQIIASNLEDRQQLVLNIVTVMRSRELSNSDANDIYDFPFRWRADTFTYSTGVTTKL